MVQLRSAWTLLIGAALIGLPALIFRIGGIHLDTELEVTIFGLGILSAAFLISTGAEAAQHDIPAALSVALIAFIAVLPEYAVDLLLEGSRIGQTVTVREHEIEVDTRMLEGPQTCRRHVRVRPGHAGRYVFRGQALTGDVPFSPGYGLQDGPAG